MPDDAALRAEAILKECPRLSPEDRFVFRCGSDLDCFTHCCRDVTIVLTPYDVLRLKRAAGLDSSEFLERHTVRLQPCGKFPVVVLEMAGEAKQCPFLSAEGCTVYADRPWACRMYPLGAAEPKAPTAEDRGFHFVVREELCHGHGQGSGISVREWLETQGAEEFEMMSAGFQELTLHPFWDGDRALTPAQADMFYMACYDLDRFRRFVFDSRFLQLFDVDEARVEALRSSDADLLDFAMQWLRYCLFGERSMKLRPDAAAGSAR
jgi:Fe-S-cluster containining protein